MWIGCLEVELYLPGINSLKEKRVILKSIKSKLRAKYNVGVAEIDDNDKWRRAVLGIVGISNDRREINSQLDQILNWLDKEREFDILDYEVKFY
ncbi:MAG: DUF503 domain-containing protein [Candidatus Omnitrophota bacterium]|nr:MAG: DUF503 domain-containing protein [Candidatus Omnitrophota bacterium]